MITLDLKNLSFDDISIDGIEKQNIKIDSNVSYDLYYVTNEDSFKLALAKVLKYIVMQEFEYSIAKEEFSYDIADLFEFELLEEEHKKAILKKIRGSCLTVKVSDEDDLYCDNQTGITNYIFNCNKSVVFISLYQS